MSATYQVTDQLSINVESHSIAFEEGIHDLVDQLDTQKGVFFASGTDYPGRYSRWDLGVVNPPVEIIGRRGGVSLQALNPRGVPILKALKGMLLKQKDITVVDETNTKLVLKVAKTDQSFPEEERSKQPTAMTPVRTLLQAFKKMNDDFLGLYGAFAYDLLFEFDPIRLNHQRADQDKLFHIFLPDSIFVVDRQKEIAQQYQYHFIVEGQSSKDIDNKPFDVLEIQRGQSNSDITSNYTDDEYGERVSKAKQRMVAGDVFEVVLSRRFQAETTLSAGEIYKKLITVNPSPYQFLIQMGDEQLIGASPEMFVRVRDQYVESCPIAGTVRITGRPIEDAEHIRELINSEKDEVELTMCTDVDRNDKARICVPGSVKVLARRQLEKYEGLYHTVDHVEGQMRDGFDGVDAFLSHMWAVTLTGAPKKMACQIIEDYELTRRDYYGGAVGVFLFNGKVNTGITIRTIHYKQGMASYQVGASLVYDSVPAEEAVETHTKATSFFKVLGQYKGKAKAVSRAMVSNGKKVVVIDNEDSFVNTLADYVRQTGAVAVTYRHGTPLAQILAEKPALVLHSPGPGRPSDFGVPDLVKQLAEKKIPQFGVCLGLQGIVEAFGGSLDVLKQPRHGKTWVIQHSQSDLFDGLPNPCTVGAYHSLYANLADFPAELEATAHNEDGIVMAIKHKTLPIQAVQFHPESIMTLTEDVGYKMIANIMRWIS